MASSLSHAKRPLPSLCITDTSLPLTAERTSMAFFDEDGMTTTTTISSASAPQSPRRSSDGGLASVSDSDLLGARPYSRQPRRSLPSLYDLAQQQTPGIRETIHDDVMRAVVAKATPRRHTLAPLDTCTLFIADDSESYGGAATSPSSSLASSSATSFVNNVLDDGRISKYRPLPSLALSPESIRKQRQADDMDSKLDGMSADRSHPFGSKLPVIGPITANSSRSPAAP